MVSGTTIATIDKTVKLGITLPKSIIQKIDQKRADIPRSRFIRRAIENYLNSSKGIDKTDNKVAAAKKRRK
jgi:metal-responsive CopG/Arc/MetJ family transcriptional regulator